MPQSAELSKPKSSDIESLVGTAVVAVVDTETTGLDSRDEPISLGVILFEVDLPKGGLVREMDAYYGLRRPSAKISPGALAIHGITAEQLAGKQFDEGRVRQMLAQADFLIAHNAEFDCRMIAQVLPEVASKPWRCSYRQIWWTDHIPVKNRKLDTICRHLGIDRPNPHNALDDCRALASALFTRTGKTARSRTFLGIALSKDDFDTTAPPRHAVSNEQQPKKAQSENDAANTLIGIVILVVVVLVIYHAIFH